MATKNQTSASEAAADQQPSTDTKELLEISELRKKHQISRSVFAGVCSVNGWKPGKTITVEEFLAAIEKFTGAPIDGKPRKDKR